MGLERESWNVYMYIYIYIYTKCACRPPRCRTEEPATYRPLVYSYRRRVPNRQLPATNMAPKNCTRHRFGLGALTRSDWSPGVTWGDSTTSASPVFEQGVGIKGFTSVSELNPGRHSVVQVCFSYFSLFVVVAQHQRQEQ